MESIEHTQLEDISAEGAEGLLKNIDKLQQIYLTVVNRLYESVENISSGAEGDIRKYSDILVCLSKEVT